MTDPTKRCKNCGKPLANHSIVRLELCRGEMHAKVNLEKLRTKSQEWEAERRQKLETELGEN